MRYKYIYHIGILFPSINYCFNIEIISNENHIYIMMNDIMNNKTITDFERGMTHCPSEIANKPT